MFRLVSTELAAEWRR